MKTIIPAVTTILGITIMTYIAACLITFQMQISGARSFHANCIDSIEASYGNESIINEWVDLASEKGYELNVEKDHMYDDRPSYKVELIYMASIPVFNLEKETSICGFAR